jgi:hypothetical protein
MSLKAELDGRPLHEDLDDKLKQCNALRSELTSLTEQMASNEKLLEQLQSELNEERKQNNNMMEKCWNECGVQTDEIYIESTKEVPVEMLAAKSEVQQQQRAHLSVLSESPTTDENHTSESVAKIKSELEPAVESEKRENEEPQASLTKLPRSKLNHGTSSTVVSRNNSNPKCEEKDDDDDDDKLNNHPKVLYEDELILFKEKCKGLTDDNIRLQREINELQATMNHFHTNWLHNFMLKYLVPVIIIFLAYIFYLLK